MSLNPGWGGTVTVLKAVPDDDVDLSEFGQRVDVGAKRWQHVLESLPPGDQVKLRAALAEPSISVTAISAWLERRKIGVHRATIIKWRARGYAETA